MTPFQAKYDKTFSAKNFRNSKTIQFTAQEKIAELLNDD